MVQVKPQTLYLEEDVTMNAELPEEGKFHLSLLPGNRYKVCGDPEEVQGSEPHQALVDPCFIALVHPCCQALVHIHVDGPSHLHGCQQLDIQDIVQIHPKGGSPVSKLWAFPETVISICDFVTRSHRKKHHHSVNKWKCVCEDPREFSISSSYFVGNSLKVSIPSEDLVILDLKYIHVTDDKGQYACKVQYCDYGYYVSLPFPLQTWSIGKHLAGACMWQNEMNMMNFENKKNKNRLSLGRKRKVDLTEDDNDERSSSHARIENGIHTVSTFYILSDST